MTKSRSGSISINGRFNGRVGGIGRVVARLTRRRKRPGGEHDLEPVESPRPMNLSGGAAAELEFDD